jgi:excisionase family DNA binding protein
MSTTGSKGSKGSGKRSPGAPASAASPKPQASGPRPPENALAEVRFLTVAEVAAVMRVSKMTVYRMVHAGDLPAVRVGRSFRVPEKAVHDYLRAAFIEAG